MAHEAIDQVAVVGYPDPRLAEVAVAFVVPAPGKSVTNDEIAAYCKGASRASRFRATCSRWTHSP